MICLNSVNEPIRRSSTTSLPVCTSTPVVSSFDVVRTTGERLSGSMKLSSSALPSALSPVIHMTYLRFSVTRSAFSLMSACRIRSAWSMSSQNTITLS